QTRRQCEPTRAPNPGAKRELMRLLDRGRAAGAIEPASCGCRSDGKNVQLPRKRVPSPQERDQQERARYAGLALARFLAYYTCCTQPPKPFRQGEATGLFSAAAVKVDGLAVKSDRLAIDGGRPVRVAPPPHWPHFAPDEIAAVVDTLNSGNVNQWTGHRVRAFERAFAEMHEQPYAVAVANGSLALEAILRAHGIGPDDEVIVTPRSFIASASCVDLVGAKPVFADIDIDTELIT